MTTGVVLAGGSSSRMGQSKAQLPFEGRTFLDRVASAVLAATGRVVVVGGPAGAPWTVIPDDGLPARGPLSGVVTGLRHTGTDVLVVAVDHPLVEATTLRHLVDIAGDRPVIPVADGVPQITCAWFPYGTLDPLGAELDRGGFIRRALDSMDVRWVHEEEWRSWGENGDSWRSIDTPDAYAAVLGGGC